CCPLHALQHRAARVELHLLLGEVRRDDAVPEPHRPTLRLALLQDRLEQRRLARAVRPDERDVLATLDREGRAVEQDAVADRNPQIFGLQDGAPAARWLEELEPELPRPAREQLDVTRRLRALLLVALDLAHLDLRLAGHLLSGRSEARDEALEPLDVGSDPAGSLRRRLQARGPLDPPFVPRSGEVRRTARLQLEHGVRNRLEEPAVVRDDPDPSVERLQLALEPLEALDVEGVRRLVEQEQIRVATQRSRPRRAGQPAARARLQPAAAP